MDLLSILRAVFGGIFVLFIPGFAWTMVLFRNKIIGLIERIALSFGLSVATVPLTIFFLNRAAGVEITLINSVVAIAGLTMLPITGYYLTKGLATLRKRVVDSVREKRQ